MGVVQKCLIAELQFNNQVIKTVIEHDLLATHT